MEIGTAEISRIIKEQIRDYEKSVEIQEIGTVLSTGDGIARVYGLDKVAPVSCWNFPTDFWRRAEPRRRQCRNRPFRRNPYDQRG